MPYLGFLYFLVLCFLILQWRFFKLPGFHPLVLVFVFVIKLGAGFLSYVYHEAYFAGGDGLIYLSGGEALVHASGGNPITFFQLLLNMHRGEPFWEPIYSSIIYWDTKETFWFVNDNRTAIRLHAILTFLGGSSALVRLVLLNFISLIGFTFLYKTFRDWFPHVDRWAMFLGVFMIPSGLFWGSGLLKETHAFFALGVYVFCLNLLNKRMHIRSLILFLFAVALLATTRTFLAIALLLPSLGVLVYGWMNNWQTRTKSIAIGVFSILLFSLVLFNTSLFELFILKQKEFLEVGSSANSFFQLTFTSNVIQFFSHIPLALIHVYIQPQLISFNSWLYVFPILENLDILTLMAIAVRYFRMPTWNKHYWFFVTSTWIIGGVIVGLTVPILGAIARYKALFMPFLVASILALIDWDVVSRKLFSFPVADSGTPD